MGNDLEKGALGKVFFSSLCLYFVKIQFCKISSQVQHFPSKTVLDPNFIPLRQMKMVFIVSRIVLSPIFRGQKMSF